MRVYVNGQSAGVFRVYPQREAKTGNVYIGSSLHFHVKATYGAIKICPDFSPLMRKANFHATPVHPEISWLIEIRNPHDGKIAVDIILEP
jgi:hypothetical protein